MSGSGGGTWIDQPGDSCATLSQQTTLNSPDRTVLSQVTKGTLLDVSVNKTGRAVTIEALFNGQVAGTITASIIQQIAECTTLLKIMVDQNAPYSTRVRAAECVMNQTMKALELDDVEARVSELERAARISRTDATSGRW